MLSDTISEIIATFGNKIFLAVLTLFLTSLVLSAMKSFVADVIFYIKARMSDIGFGQYVFYQKELYSVRQITFKYLILNDDEKIIRIPLKTYMTGTIIFPRPKHEQDK